MLTKFFLLGAIFLTYTLGSFIMHRFLFEIAINSDSFPSQGEKTGKELMKEAYSWVLSVHFMSLIWPITLGFAVVLTLVSLLRELFTVGR
ncbi:MAG: hypothetical protein EBT03_11795 [Betaproteobacteria bacterium]|nr:hypothetical protein [Betaproteobacteria bacterium]